MQSLNLPFSNNIQFMPLFALFEDSGPKFRHGGTERQRERACARTLALKPQNPGGSRLAAAGPRRWGSFGSDFGCFGPGTPGRALAQAVEGDSLQAAAQVCHQSIATRSALAFLPQRHGVSPGRHRFVYRLNEHCVVTGG